MIPQLNDEIPVTEEHLDAAIAALDTPVSLCGSCLVTQAINHKYGPGHESYGGKFDDGSGTMEYVLDTKSSSLMNEFDTMVSGLLERDVVAKSIRSKLPTSLKIVDIV